MAANDIVVGLRINAHSEEARRKVEQIEKKIGKLGREARTAAARSETAFRRMAGATRPASAQVANLAAQFNDIGQMLMSGQSPLMLAVQQGTQITQVIGPLGARGAVQALGQAFLSLLSPVNLVTLGVIAGGAALVQWLTSAEEQARTVADALDEVEANLKDVERFTERAAAPLSSLRREFGDAGEQARELYAAMADIARLDALDRLEAAARTLRKEFEGGWFSGGLQGYLNQLALFDRMEQGGVHPGDVARVRKRVLEDLREEYGLTRIEAEKLAAALDRMREAHGPEQVAAAAQALREVFAEIETRAGRVPDQLRAAAAEVARMQLDALKLKAIAESATRVTRERERAARRLLEQLRDEAALQAMIRLYGKDSLAVERLRRMQAEEAFRARLDEMDVSEELKRQLIDTFSVARGLASVEIDAAIRRAADEAQRFYDRMADALGLVGEVGRRAAVRGVRQGAIPPEALADLRSDTEDRMLARVRASRRSRSSRRSRGGGGGGRALDQTRAAYERLRASIDEAFASELRFREAQETVNAALEAGIITQAEADETLRRLQDTLGSAGSAAKQLADLIKDDLLDGLAGIRDLGSAFESLGQKIRRAALEALLFNEGWFKVEGGGKGLIGGLFAGGGLFGGAIIPGVLHDGGVAGHDGYGHGRTVPSWVFAGAPRYHAGGIAGLRPGEVPAILERGEVVLPRGVQPGVARAEVVVRLGEGLVGGILEQARGDAQAVSVQVVQEYNRRVLPERLRSIQRQPGVAG